MQISWLISKIKCIGDDTKCAARRSQNYIRTSGSAVAMLRVCQ